MILPLVHNKGSCPYTIPCLYLSCTVVSVSKRGVSFVSNSTEILQYSRKSILKLEFYQIAYFHNPFYKEEKHGFRRLKRHDMKLPRWGWDELRLTNCFSPKTGSEKKFHFLLWQLGAQAKAHRDNEAAVSKSYFYICFTQICFHCLDLLLFSYEW